jgi:carboxymethylenebutenolidase
MQINDVELGVHATPDSGVHPGIVLIHDVWGVTEHTRDLAQRLAGEGYGVLALDLYRREASVAIKNPGEWMRALSDPLAEGDVQASVDFLGRHAATSGQKVGVIGFCMGGMYALLAASSCRGLSAAVPFYGILSHRHGLLFSEEGLDPVSKPREPLDAVAGLSCPLLGIFGGRDEFVPMSDIEDLERRLAATDHATEVAVYPEAGHAFLNDTREDAFRSEDAGHAWSRMLDFLGANLR